MKSGLIFIYALAALVSSPAYAADPTSGSDSVVEINEPETAATPVAPANAATPATPAPATPSAAAAGAPAAADSDVVESAPGDKAAPKVAAATGTSTAASAAPAPPAAPEKTRRVDLEWEPVGKASRYDLQISLDPGFEKPLIEKSLKTTVFTADLEPGPYFYRVRGVDQGGIPGRWTPSQELNINPKPPTLIAPPNGTRFVGPLPDTGIQLLWKTNTPGAKFLIESHTTDPLTGEVKVAVKQEITDEDLDFFPQVPGKYQWSVGSLGAAGMEEGDTWEFEVEGVFPRKVPKGETPHRIVRYIAPWWRGHWTLFSRYGQANSSYSMVDQDLRASSAYSAIIGYIDETLNWEWHDPAGWAFRGIPWAEFEYQLSRQTVLSESVLLSRYELRMGAWYDEWLDRWRFSPVLGFGARDLAIYQPRSQYEAARSNSRRSYVQFGPAAEFELKPYLTLGAAFHFNYEWGGDAGLQTVNGDQLDLSRRAGGLLPALNYEAQVTGTMTLNPRLQLQGRIRFESLSERWVPLFPNQITPGITPGNTTFGFTNLGFDVSVGIKF